MTADDLLFYFIAKIELKYYCLIKESPKRISIKDKLVICIGKGSKNKIKTRKV